MKKIKGGTFQQLCKTQFSRNALMEISPNQMHKVNKICKTSEEVPPPPSSVKNILLEEPQNSTFAKRYVNEKYDACVSGENEST